MRWMNSDVLKKGSSRVERNHSACAQFWVGVARCLFGVVAHDGEVLFRILPWKNAETA